MTAGLADAKSTYESPYGYDRTWNAALRLVRVDNGWKVTEKDDQNGYLLFDYMSPENSSKKKTSPGTLELVRGRDPDAPVSVLVQLPDDAAVPRADRCSIALDQDAARVRRSAGAQEEAAGGPAGRRRRRDGLTRHAPVARRPPRRDSCMMPRICSFPLA